MNLTESQLIDEIASLRADVCGLELRLADSQVSSVYGDSLENTILSQMLIESSRTGIFAFDRKFRYIIWNPAMERIFGLSKEKCLGKCAFDVFPFLEEIGEDRFFRSTLNGDSPVTEIRPYTVPETGQSGYFRGYYNPLRSSSGTIVGGMAFIQDITRMKQDSELILKKSEGRYQELLSNLNSGVVVHEADTTITLANPTALKLLGLSMDQMIGKTAMDPHWKFLREDGSDMPLEEFPVQLVIGRGENLKDYIVGVNRPVTNDVVWVLCNGFRVMDDGGELNHVIITFVDITEMKFIKDLQFELEDRLRQSQKMEAVGRLAGGVAHDFNNILTCVMGFSELLLDKMASDDPGRGDVGEIIKATDSAAALTGQLLAFTRKQVISPRILDVGDVLKNSNKMLLRILGEDLELTVVPTENLWNTKIDLGQLDQILINLAVNARDAMSAGGKLSFELSNVSMAVEQCSHCGKPFSGDYVLLEVSDNGDGMERRTMDKIFEPFFTTKGDASGTGLGLSTVEGIVYQNRGHIFVQSELGSGTTFKIYLPRANGDVEDLPEVAEVIDVRGSESILLVEDQELVRNAVSRILDDLGYTVYVAEDADQAMRLMRKVDGAIDVMVIDVVLPKMNGRDLHKHLLEFKPGLPAIFMSGYTENVIVNHGLVNPGIEYLQKPFKPRLLAEKVREVLDRTIQ